jgi:hypothetical protein
MPAPAPADGSEAQTAVLTTVATGAADAVARRGNGAAPDADALVTAQSRGATAEDTTGRPDAPPTAETTAALPADQPGTGETTEALPADQPTTAEATAVLPDGPPATPARRRDGIVVPLRVPLRLRLRAATGLMFMVVVLGVITAAVVVALALAGAQVLSNF